MQNDTMFSLFNRETNLGKEFYNYTRMSAFSNFLLPILPIAISEGLKGYVNYGELNSSIENIVNDYFIEISPNKDVASERMNQFLQKCSKSHGEI